MRAATILLALAAMAFTAAPARADSFSFNIGYSSGGYGYTTSYYDYYASRIYDGYVTTIIQPAPIVNGYYVPYTPYGYDPVYIERYLYDPYYYPTTTVIYRPYAYRYYVPPTTALIIQERYGPTFSFWGNYGYGWGSPYRGHYGHGYDYYKHYDRDRYRDYGWHGDRDRDRDRNERDRYDGDRHDRYGRSAISGYDYGNPNRNINRNEYDIDRRDGNGRGDRNIVQDRYDGNTRWGNSQNDGRGSSTYGYNRDDVSRLARTQDDLSRIGRSEGVTTRERPETPIRIGDNDLGRRGDGERSGINRQLDDPRSVIVKSPPKESLRESADVERERIEMYRRQAVEQNDRTRATLDRERSSDLQRNRELFERPSVVEQPRSTDLARDAAERQRQLLSRQREVQDRLNQNTRSLERDVQGRRDLELRSRSLRDLETQRQRSSALDQMQRRRDPEPQRLQSQTEILERSRAMQRQSQPQIEQRSQPRMEQRSAPRIESRSAPRVESSGGSSRGGESRGGSSRGGGMRSRD